MCFCKIKFTLNFLPVLYRRSTTLSWLVLVHSNRKRRSKWIRQIYLDRFAKLLAFGKNLPITCRKGFHNPSIAFQHLRIAPLRTGDGQPGYLYVSGVLSSSVWCAYTFGFILPVVYPDLRGTRCAANCERGEPTSIPTVHALGCLQSPITES